MTSELYVRLILALAPAVVGLAWSLDEDWTKARARATSLCGILFALSVLWSPLKIWGALPWLGLTSIAAWRSGISFWGRKDFPTSSWAGLASGLYLPVGCVWALFDQARWQPLGFSGIIVLLTAVHFHYAGFALPRLTSLWLEAAKPMGAFRAAGWGVVLGVPLVAVGITASQLSLPHEVEVISVSLLAASAFTISLGQLHWTLADKTQGIDCRTLFSMGAISLSLGMVLAVIYGWRSVVSISWIDIPFMYSVHGTLNSLGFCLPTFLAWKRLLPD